MSLCGFRRWASSTSRRALEQQSGHRPQSSSAARFTAGANHGSGRKHSANPAASRRCLQAKLARMAKHHVARLQVNDHIAEAVSGRSKDWIKMKNPAAREMVVKKAEKTRTHFIFRTEHLAALGTFRLA
jgi:hypothetical protein